MEQTNQRLDNLEHRVDRLEDDLMTCGVDKDNRINAMHSDMLDLKETVQALTEEIRSAVTSLKEIARNTSTVRELAEMYEKWKGFTWVVKNAGFWVAIFAAFSAGALIAAINGVSV